MARDQLSRIGLSGRKLDELATVGAPFGSSDYIHDELTKLYFQRLALIADELPIAGELLNVLKRAPLSQRRRFLEHPSVKSSIQHAFRRFLHKSLTSIPLADCESVISIATRQVIAGHEAPATDLPLSAMDRLGPRPHHPFVWSDDNSDDPFRVVFRELVHQNFDGPVASHNSASVVALQRGIALLEEVVPHIATSALGHVQVVALFPASGSWQSMASCSQYRFSGAVFLRQESLIDPWWVAEYLLHEAVHQKLYDIRETHSLIAADSVFRAPSGELSRTGTSDLLQPPWNRQVSLQRDEWPISRVLAAVHVYVHLAILAANEEERLSELERKYGPRRTGALGLVGSRSAFDRASFLVDALNGSRRDELGPAGICLVSWIAQCLDLLATRPSRPRLELRLALERYEREANATQLLLDKSLEGGRERDAPSTTLITGLVDQLAFECNEAHNIINQINGAVIETSTELESIRSAVPTSLETLGFLGVRRIIGSALGNSLTLWSTGESPVGDASRTASVTAALNLIDVSTDRLAAISGSKPPRTDNTRTPLAREETVLDANAGASLFELTDVLGQPYGTEDFCFFLYSLIRMNRPRTIVELGTGYGCSALWMALGCKVSGSGHVWSFDDGTRLDSLPELLSESRDRLARTAWANLDRATPSTMNVILARLGLESHVTFVRERMSLAPGTKLLTQELHEPIDLLFADFRHDPAAITSILAYFLPRMAPSSSIFIDSASSFQPSYILLEHLAGHVEMGELPPMLQDAAIVDIKARLDNHRITLVHLTKVGRSEQNSVAWLKLEPNHVPTFPDVR